MIDPDFNLALLLEEQFKREAEIESGSKLVYKKNPQPDSSKSLVDPSWELIDPTPNIHNLFVIFNERFFWNKLNPVCVSWSKRMTTCAGICTYHSTGLCTIALSEPLLKLRPRKDLVETLLHEMIHAYMFVTRSNKDRDDHGPEFHKHMNRINKEAGTNITVYHDFYDEVRWYQQHWWRCDGPCKNRKPYFGLVRRATNRAPGPNDYWWAEHSRTCGGTFIKVKEPDNFKNKSKDKAKVKPPVNPKNDIRIYLENTQGVAKIRSLKDLVAKVPSSGKTTTKNSNSVVVVIKTGTSNDKTDQTPNSNTKNNGNSENNKIIPFFGEGKILNDSKNGTNKGNEDYSIVRNHWINKYQVPSTSKPTIEDNKKRPSASNSDNIKRPKIESAPSVTDVTSEDSVDCPVCGNNFNKTLINEHIDKCLLEAEAKENEKELCFICKESILRKDLNVHVNICLNKTTDDGKVKCDICNKTFEREKFTGHYENCIEEVLSKIDDKDAAEFEKCPVCHKYVNRWDYYKHTEECTCDNFILGGVEKVKGKYKQIPCLVCKKPIMTDELEKHLDQCIEKIFMKKNVENETESEDFCGHSCQKFGCPICFAAILESEMNEHLNLCLGKK